MRLIERSTARWASLLPALSVAATVLAAAVASAQSAYVRDDAGILSAPTISAIEQRDAQLKSATGKSISVVTIDSTNGTPVQQAAQDAARAQGLNGAIIYIAKSDHHFKVAYGRNTQRAFPAELRASIESDMTAAFRNNDFDGGVLAGVNAIADRIQSRPAAQTGAAPRAHPVAEPAAQAASGGGIPWIWLLLGVGALFLILRSFARRSPLGPPPGPGGAQPGAVPPGAYPPGGYPAPGMGGGGFMPGLLGGALGGFVGNELANNMNRGGQPGGDPAMAAGDSGTGGGWQGDDAGAGFGDGGAGGDFGGGGGDFGGGGDSGGSW